ncbi:MAG: L-histidine N(alpha)-methyltransferase [Alphaproteobacteria bacterium]|nr:L-histidine N(alpha)-methyltransferase [Alphaproteobacteria bacterium]
MNIKNNIILTDRRKTARSNFKKDFERVLKMCGDTNLSPYLYGKSEKDDVRGAELWEWVLKNVPEYYLKSAEIEILNSPKILYDISAIIGKNATLIELGPGSTVLEKTAPLINKLDGLLGYVCVDITPQYAENSAQEINEKFLDLKSFGIVGNFLDKRLKDYLADIKKPIFFSVGNTLCNIPEDHSSDCPANTILALKKFREIAHEKGYLIVSQDTNQDEDSLYRAYFNKGFKLADINVLNRVKSELGINIDKDKYKLQAAVTRQNENQCCISRHLVATKGQDIVLDDLSHAIQKGDTLEINRSYKFNAEYFQKMAAEAGWEEQAVYFDSTGKMALHVLKAI